MHPRRAFALSMLSAFLLCAAVSAQTAPAEASAAAAAAPSASPTPPALVILAPAKLRQGDPLLAWILDPGAAKADPGSASAQSPEARLLDAKGRVVARNRCFEASGLFAEPAAAASDGTAAQPAAVDGAAQPAAAFPPGSVYGALFALPPELKPGAYSLAVSGSSLAIAVAERDFPIDTVKLNESNTKIKTEPSPRKDDEAKRLYEILLAVDGSALFADGSAFLFPVEGGFQSSGFGDRRRYLYSSGKSETSSHAGIDWAVVKDTEVRACERGKVVLAAEREVTGNTLVLEHLPGLYSLYFHLASLEVAEGQIVERGQLIARSGSTGLSTGPHLHWELRAGGEAVDPKYWMAAPLLDKEAIKARMVGLIEGR